MIKTIIKESFIIILICLAIILIMGIVFYEYIPVLKVIPTPISYTVPEEIKNELTEEETQNIDTPTTIYQITTSDLKKYEDMGIYEKGKSNPFAITSQNNNNNNTVNNSTESNSDNQSSSTLFNTVGK